MSKQKTTNTIRREVVGIFRELMTDPDAGLELSQNVVIRLGKSVISKKQGRTVSLESILEKYR